MPIPTARHFRALAIEQPYIVLMGSGNSIQDISPQAFDFIKSRAFVITINYGPLRFKGHLNMWSDLKVSEFLEEFYRTHPKETLFLAQHRKVQKSFVSQVDYWFSPRQDQLKGNYTVVWALQLLQRFFPKKIILLFGIDMYALDPNRDKWYDQFTDFDRAKRGENYNIQQKLQSCAIQIQRYCRRTGVYNCNPKSKLTHFEKRDWRTILPLKITHLSSDSGRQAIASAYTHKVLHRYTNCLSYNLSDHSAAATKNRQLQWADVLHHHQGIAPLSPTPQNALLQTYSPSASSSDAPALPYLIDIWDDQHRPVAKSIDRVNIMVCWPTDQQVTDMPHFLESLRQVETKYGQMVQLVIGNELQQEERLRKMQLAHICIDLGAAGSYSLVSLEACAAGTIVLNRANASTKTQMEALTGQTDLPFVPITPTNLFEKLCFYIDHPGEHHAFSIRARAWMEQHWDPRYLVLHYLKAYFDIALYGHILAKAKSPIPTERAPFTGVKMGQRGTSLRKKPLVSVRNKRKRPDYKHPEGIPAERSIQQLYQKYAGQEIYIFGTGPSLLKVDPALYKDKLCFGINFAFEHMPYMDYHFVHVVEVYEVLRKVVDPKQLILPETLVWQWRKGVKPPPRANRIPVNPPSSYVYPLQNPYLKNIQMKHVSLDQQADIFNWSTTLHSAIHLAAYMGARTIKLIGVDYRLFANGKVHFDSIYHPEYGQQKWHAHAKHKQGVEWLAYQLKQQGVRVEYWSSRVGARRILQQGRT
ncbi:MAG: hypothetical protein AAF798_09685 [Bacteroidota bacterium]